MTAVSERVAEALTHLAETDPDHLLGDALAFVGRNLVFATVDDGQLSTCVDDESDDDLISIATVVLAMRTPARRIHSAAPVVTWSGQMLDLNVEIITSGPAVAALTEAMDQMAVTS